MLTNPEKEVTYKYKYPPAVCYSAYQGWPAPDLILHYKGTLIAGVPWAWQ